MSTLVSHDIGMEIESVFVNDDTNTCLFENHVFEEFIPPNQSTIDNFCFTTEPGGNCKLFLDLET